MSDEDQVNTADDAETGDDEFVATDEDLDAISDNADDDADIDDPGDGDDSDDLYADLSLSAADRSDVGGGVEDEPTEIRELTPDELEADEHRREYDLRAKTFGERVSDMHRGPSHGERRSAAMWAQHFEAEGQASIDAASPDAEAANEAKAVANVAKYMQAEDLDEGPGVISGDDTKPDHADAAKRRKNAMSHWDDFCNDPDN